MPEPKTCPRCFGVVDPRASVCPHCKKRLKTSRTTWGCLVLIGLVAIGAVIEQMVNPSRTPTPPTIKTDTQTGQKYVAGPENRPAPAKDVEPLLHVREVLAARGKQIQTVLTRELGAGATLKYETGPGGVKQWVGKKDGLTLEVLPDKGRVLSVIVLFNPPARDWAAALALVGLNPYIQPTANPAAGPLWRGRVFQDIDEVHGFYYMTDGTWRTATSKVQQLSITPDKGAYDRWTREE